MERLRLTLYNHRYLVTIICIIIIGILSYFFYFKDKIFKEEIVIEEEIKEENEVIENSFIYIDIKGAVNNPGVYKIDSNSRVIDAINKAEGLKEGADTSLLNLSAKLHDEMYIYIYTKEEVVNFVKVNEEKNQQIDECKKTNSVCIDKEDIKEDEVVNNKININKASIKELMLLPNIGEAKAQAIIDYRNSVGIFKTINDIKNVSGIGESLFDKIKDLITV
jgi:competence protein ComEA